MNLEQRTYRRAWLAGVLGAVLLAFGLARWQAPAGAAPSAAETAATLPSDPLALERADAFLAEPILPTPIVVPVVANGMWLPVRSERDDSDLNVHPRSVDAEAPIHFLAACGSISRGRGTSLPFLRVLRVYRL